jgi:predicted small integral membrane protein
MNEKTKFEIEIGDNLGCLLWFIAFIILIIMA